MTTAGQKHEVDVAADRLVKLVAAKRDAELTVALTEFIRTINAVVDLTVKAAVDRIEQDQQMSAENLGDLN